MSDNTQIVLLLLVVLVIGAGLLYVVSYGIVYLSYLAWPESYARQIPGFPWISESKWVAEHWRTNQLLVGLFLFVLALLCWGIWADEHR